MSYRIDPHASLTAEVRRIAGEELDMALHWLSTAGGAPDKALHEARKRLKSIRALLALIRSGDKPFARTENERYRQAAAQLAGPRQAGALIETVDRLAQTVSGKAGQDAIAAVRENLLAHRGDILSGDMDQALAAAASACREGLSRFEELVLPDIPEEAADILAAGAARTLRRARHALRIARAREEEDAFHDLRKAAKAHMMHLSLLRDFWPSPVKARRKAVAELAEHLGELQDIFVLRKLLRDGDPAVGSPVQNRKLDQICKRSERSLRKTCLTQADDLFQDNPKRPARKIVRKVRRDMAGARPVDA